MNASLNTCVRWMRVCLAHTACFQTFFLPLRPRADRGELPATAFKSERCPYTLTRGLLGIWSSIPYWHAMAVLGKFEPGHDDRFSRYVGVSDVHTLQVVWTDDLPSRVDERRMAVDVTKYLPSYHILFYSWLVAFIWSCQRACGRP